MTRGSVLEACVWRAVGTSMTRGSVLEACVWRAVGTSMTRGSVIEPVYVGQWEPL